MILMQLEFKRTTLLHVDIIYLLSDQLLVLCWSHCSPSEKHSYRRQMPHCFMIRLMVKCSCWGFSAVQDFASDHFVYMIVRKQLFLVLTLNKVYKIFQGFFLCNHFRY